jgi:hypothetical protein
MRLYLPEYPNLPGRFCLPWMVPVHTCYLSILLTVPSVTIKVWKVNSLYLQSRLESVVKMLFLGYLEGENFII